MEPGVIGHERNPAETGRCKRTKAGGSSVNPGIVWVYTHTAVRLLSFLTNWKLLVLLLGADSNIEKGRMTPSLLL